MLREDITDEELKEIAYRRKIRERKIRIKETENQRKKERKFIEFSKKIMFFVMSTAFIVILFSMYIIRFTSNTTYLDTLIIETMNFAKIGLGFYSAKAAVENYAKIKNKKIIEDFKHSHIQDFIDNLEKNNKEIDYEYKI